MFNTKRFTAALVLALFPLVIAGTPGAVFGGEPPGPGESLAGPPVVGTMVLQGMPDAFGNIQNVFAEFTGTCVNAFDNKCSTPCSARFDLANVPVNSIPDRDGSGAVDFLDLLPSDLLTQRINTANARGCIDKFMGSEIMIQTVIDLTPMDEDMDGIYEMADVDIILLYIVTTP